MKYIVVVLLMVFFLGKSQEVILSEKFKNGIADDWKVESNVKNRNWYAKSFRDTHYVTMSAFGGKGKKGYKVVASLHSPLLNLENKTCKLKFSFADAYQNGQPLQVYITGDNFGLIKKLNESSWEKLVNNKGKYDNKYQSTEWIPLPKLDKPYRVSFTYESKKDNKIITTVIQLKEVDVWCEE